MTSSLSEYLLCSGFMLIILAILAVRTNVAIKQTKSRNRTFMLIGTTALYIIMDAAFITCHLSEKICTTAWEIISFLFYLTYVALPFIWYIFVRNFVGTKLKSFIRNLECIPLIVLVGLVVVTPFTGLLWSVNDAGMYERGPGFLHFSIINYFYYLAPMLDIIVVIMNKNIKNEPYLFHSIFISLVPLLGAIVNSLVIPVGTIFPFQPFCSVIVVLLGFCFIASKDSDVLKDQQQTATQLALSKAEAAGRIKTRFLSDMSHDIRTPMNAIVNLTDLSLTENDINVVHGYLEKIQLSSNFLLGLINDILDMSRIESGEFTLHKQNLTRTEFLNSIETVVFPLIQKKNINFHPEVNPGEYTINVDKLRFNQIFFNLLSNAAKYTPEGGDVWLEVHNEEVNNNKLKIRFVVRDTGIGMSEEFLEHIFEPFAREETDFNIRTQGTGLGLSIVKRLVDAMDGTITVKSKLGQGSEFTVILYADIVARVELESPKKILEDTHSLEGMRIMLVEDNELNTYVEKIILEKAGCIVTDVDNGKKAVDKFLQNEPYSFDAIMMDLRMPVMGGIEATKIIRQSSKMDAKTIPIIAMTADVFEDAESETQSVGMDYHLSKPVDAEKIYHTLNAIRNGTLHTEESNRKLETWGHNVVSKASEIFSHNDVDSTGPGQKGFKLGVGSEQNTPPKYRTQSRTRARNQQNRKRK